MNTYFFDDANGLDTNDGLAPATAWQTLAMASSAAVVKGSTLLFRCGGSFPGALTLVENCTYASYGAGAKPQLGAGVQYCINNYTYKDASGNLHHAVDGNQFFGLRFSGSSDTLVNMIGANNWQFASCEFDNTGAHPVGPYTNVRGLLAQACTVAQIVDCWFHDITGDCIYSEAMKQFTISSSRFDAPQGAAADGIQVGYDKAGNGPQDITITNNTINMRSVPTNSGKGGIIVQKASAGGSLLVDGVAKGCLIEGNTVVGLNFGIAVGGDDIVVRNNRVSAATLNSYSWGIGAADPIDCHRHQWYGNAISGCTRGLAITWPGTGTPPFNRIDFEIHDNEITSCPTALHIDQPISGYAQNNDMIGCASKFSRTGQGLIVPAGGAYTTWEQTPNHAFDADPVTGTFTNL